MREGRRRLSLSYLVFKATSTLVKRPGTQSTEAALRFRTRLKNEGECVVANSVA